MSRDQDRTSKLSSLRDAISAHPGYKADLDWQALQRMHAILGGNFNELMNALDRPSSNPDLALELIQNVRPPNVRTDFFLTLDRLLHNFLASVASLIDHTRNIVRHYQSTTFAGEYERRVGQLADAPLPSFMKDFRNYLLHYRLPLAEIK